MNVRAELEAVRDCERVVGVMGDVQRKGDRQYSRGAERRCRWCDNTLGTEDFAEHESRCLPDQRDDTLIATSPTVICFEELEEDVGWRICEVLLFSKYGVESRMASLDGQVDAYDLNVLDRCPSGGSAWFYYRVYRHEGHDVLAFDEVRRRVVDLDGSSIRKYLDHFHRGPVRGWERTKTIRRGEGGFVRKDDLPPEICLHCGEGQAIKGDKVCYECNR